MTERIMHTIPFTLADGEPFIPLTALLKVTDVAATGGEAQQMIVEGCVSRNGQVETRKRAKIVAGDVIELNDVRILVQAHH